MWRVYIFFQGFIFEVYCNIAFVVVVLKLDDGL